MPDDLTVFSHRLAALQQKLSQEGLNALWVSAADAHLNEYLPEACKHRDWLCGFTGSAGELLVGEAESFLFVDSRYHEQAEHEVPQEVKVVKLGLKGQLTLLETVKRLISHAEKPFKLVVDAQTVSASQIKPLLEIKNGLEVLASNKNWVHELKEQTGESILTPLNPVYALPVEVTGQSTPEKLALVRQKMQAKNAALLPLTKLDEIAWLLNLRGRDIAYNPVFISYVLIGLEQAWLFIESDRVEKPALGKLEVEAITILPYTEFQTVLRQAAQALKPNQSVWLQPSAHTWATQMLLQKACKPNVKLEESLNPVLTLKAVKNRVELEGMRLAGLKASVAIIETLAWLANQASKKALVTEQALADTLEDNYKAQGGFKGLSFNTISGGGPASSIVHYGLPNATRGITEGDWVLLDSGAQYLEEKGAGTTDTTRTTVFGKSFTPKQKKAFTGVLKGHLALASSCFPQGTTGAQLDSICRNPLWQAGLDYGHGTGHGVGAFLNVHEGPIGIHSRATLPLEPGNIVSVEPGYYEPGWGGIRLENLVEVAEKANPEKEIFKGSGITTWLELKPLVYIPFEANLIEPEQLTSTETLWLKAYYQTTQQKLKGLLSPLAQSWLNQQTAWLLGEPAC